MFNYVNITSKECEGWINLFFEDECIALIDNKFLAVKIKRHIDKETKFDKNIIPPEIVNL